MKLHSHLAITRKKHPRRWHLQRNMARTLQLRNIQFTPWSSKTLFEQEYTPYTFLIRHNFSFLFSRFWLSPVISSQPFIRSTRFPVLWVLTTSTGKDILAILFRCSDELFPAFTTHWSGSNSLFCKCMSLCFAKGFFRLVGIFFVRYPNSSLKSLSMRGSRVSICLSLWLLSSIPHDKRISKRLPNAGPPFLRDNVTAAAQRIFVFLAFRCSLVISISNRYSDERIIPITPCWQLDPIASDRSVSSGLLCHVSLRNNIGAPVLFILNGRRGQLLCRRL